MEAAAVFRDSLRDGGCIDLTLEGVSLTAAVESIDRSARHSLSKTLCSPIYGAKPGVCTLQLSELATNI